MFKMIDTALASNLETGDVFDLDGFKTVVSQDDHPTESSLVVVVATDEFDDSESYEFAYDLQVALFVEVHDFDEEND